MLTREEVVLVCENRTSIIYSWWTSVHSIWSIIENQFLESSRYLRTISEEWQSLRARDGDDIEDASESRQMVCGGKPLPVEAFRFARNAEIEIGLQSW